ncbi:pilus assembly protein Flp/PilA [Aquabacter spiritensis]|uniref:Pilus assembly protein Flp/PilA n=2 Tax=Aquabacter spiritensis TaxID=933073 RepID=A0A4R3M3E3_9HYPH|nr:pilus assembly protein Flp/PilA [Aquabacter spiritensis]
MEGRAGWPSGHAAEEWAMKLLLTRFVKEEKGSTALEYGLIAAGLSIAIITVITQVGFTLVRLKAAGAAAGN